MTCRSATAALVVSGAALLGAAGIARAQTAGSITGRVTSEATGAALAGVEVTLTHSATHDQRTTLTNASGDYAFPQVLAGTYFLHTTNAQGYLDELFDDLPCLTGDCTYDYPDGTPVSVPAGATVGAIDFALATGGTIAGTVTDASTGAGLAGVPLAVYLETGFPEPSYLGSAQTTSAGAYAVGRLPTGTYYVVAFNSQTHAGELYDGLPCPGGACDYTTGTPVGVTQGATTGGIDFALAGAGTITGRVTDAATGSGLAGVRVTAYLETGGEWLLEAASAYTTPTGAYSIGGLSPGTYYALTSNADGYVDESSTPVTVTTGATTSAVDFALETGGTLSGRVTDGVTGAGLAGVRVYVYPDRGGAPSSSAGEAATTVSGTYTVRGLVTGNYRVRTSNGQGYADELFDDVVCLPNVTCPLAAAHLVPVTTGEATSGIDFALAALSTATGAVTGRVTDAETGAPLAGLRVAIKADGVSDHAWFMETDAGGQYSFSRLPPGAYFLYTASGEQTTGSLSYQDEFYDNQPCPLVGCYWSDQLFTGAPVNLTAGTTTSGVDFALAPGGTVSGTVTDALTGTGLASVEVEVCRFLGGGYRECGTARTGSTGSYVKTGLPPGTYYVNTNTSTANSLGFSTGFVDELYDDVTCPGGLCESGEGTALSVNARQTTGGVDFALAAGGTIKGVVRSAPTGLALSGVEVYVYRAAEGAAPTWAGYGRTDSSGSYAIRGLPTGTYYVGTSSYPYPGIGAHVDELYPDLECEFGCDLTTGAPVSVTAPATTRGIDFSLAVGGRITGTVTDAATGAGLSDVSLALYQVRDGAPRLLRDYEKAVSGSYAIQGLPTGTYFVMTSNRLGYIDELHAGQLCPWGSCAVTNGTPVSVTIGQTTSGIDFALTMGGKITGRVTDAITGAGLAYVAVEVYDSTGGWAGQVPGALTTKSGTYTIISLLPGAYYLRTSNSLDYLDELHADVFCDQRACDLATGTPVPASLGATTAGIDFALLRGGTITGTVTDAATGTGLADYGVSVYRALGDTSSVHAGGARTTSTGAYSVGRLPTGTYYVKTFDWQGYVDELYDDLPCPGQHCTVTTGTPVGVVVGAATTGKDFALVKGGRITGRVTSAAGGAGLAGVLVQVYRSTGGSYAPAGFARTDETGAYAVTGLVSDTYYVGTSNDAGYADELYNDVPCPGGACDVTTGAPVSVTLGATTSGIDFALAVGGRISGRVTSAVTGAGLAGVVLKVHRAAGGIAGEVTTDGTGAFTVGGLSTGTYYVRTANDAGYLDELYNDLPCPGGSCAITSGSPVSVTAGATTGGIDFTLVVGGRIGGRVTDLATGQGIAGVTVTAFPVSGAWYSSAGSAVADGTGAYSIVGLGSGAYYVLTRNTAGYADEVYDDVPCRSDLGTSCDYRVGAPVNVAAGATTGGVDFGLARGGSISGRVTDAVTGQGLAGVRVWFYRPSASSYTTDGRVFTDRDGAYTVGGLAAASYRVFTENSTGYVDELYDNVPCPTSCYYRLGSGTPVSVTAGATVTGKDFALVQGGRVSGRVTDAATGAGIAQLKVQLLLASGGSYTDAGLVYTDSTGAYRTYAGLPAGTYYVYTVDAAAQGYFDEIYNDVRCGSGCSGALGSGTPVSVTAGGTAGAIDFALSSSEVIRGRVTDAATGAGLGGIYVAAQRVGTYTWVSSVRTGSTGAYTLGGLTAGSYYLRTSNTLGYLDELYNDLPCPNNNCTSTDGLAVTVATGTATTGIDFALALGGTIAGTVTDAATGAPLPNVRIMVHPVEPGLIHISAGNTMTTSAGAYEIRGLPAGSYYVRTFWSTSHVDELHSDVPCPDSCDLRSGVPVGVTGGATSRVDFGLARGGRISGRVTSAASGAGLANTYVYLYRATGGSYADSGLALTDSAGNFWSPPLPPGSYYLRTYNWAGYADELYDNLPCPYGGCSYTAGLPVPVMSGATTGGIDFALASTSAPGTLQLGAATHRVAEPTGAVTVTVTRTDGATGTVSVTLATGNGTATSGSDYVAVSQVVTFGPGDVAPKAVSIPIADDGLAEGSEIFTVTLSGATGGATLGTRHATTVIITDEATAGAANPAASARLNFDGDLRTDIAVYRSSTGQWFVLPSSTNFTTGWAPTVFGDPGKQDTPLWGDFDGDGKRDFAVYRPGSGTWFWLKSSVNGAQYEWKGWGLQSQGDLPVPGDYDGDGTMDPTLYRPAHGTWFILRSGSDYGKYWAFGWGQPTDVPMAGDYDGDARTDIAVYRPATGEWFVLPSSTGFATGWAPTVFGQAGDVPLRGDFDGDGKSDFAVYRPGTGTWFWLKSSTNNTQYGWKGWGLQAQGDVPVPGDYDGDGKTDPTVYRQNYGTWFVLRSDSNFSTYWAIGWGAPADTPLGGMR